MKDQCLVIKPDGNLLLADYPHRASISEENACLRELIGKGCEFHEAVRISFADQRLIMLVDEEGRLKSDLQYNSLASILYGGWIMGTALLMQTDINNAGETILYGFDYDELLWLAERLREKKKSTDGTPIPNSAKLKKHIYSISERQ